MEIIKLKRYFVKRNILVQFLVISFICFVSLSQAYASSCNGTNYAPGSNPPPACGNNPAAGNTCNVATPICDLNGYCGSTASSYTADYWSQLNNAFCGSLENNSFLKFTASATSMTFNVWITYSECGDGIQIMVFSAAGNCSGAVTSYQCWSPGSASAGPTAVTATNLIPGNEYYIMIDGFAGDVVNYVIGVGSGGGGVALPVAVSPTTANFCPGGSTTLTATGGDGTYTWSGGPGMSSTTGSSITVVPPTAGTYTYTVTSNSTSVCSPGSSSASAVITVNSCGCTVSADVTSPPICTSGPATVNLVSSDGGTISWTATQSGLTGATSGTGSTISNTLTATGQSPGTATYTVISQSASCTSDPLIVTIPVNPVATPIDPQDTVICVGFSTLYYVPSPSGGTVTQDGTYNVHTFTTDGTFSAPIQMSADVLVVGGGGGSGNNGGGGGGAGGVLYQANTFIASGTSPVTVGDGGLTSVTNFVNGSNGESSIFGSFVANGGGGGASRDGGNPGQNGASGGGGGGGIGPVNAANTARINPGNGTLGQGNNGGPGTPIDYSCGAAGGGGGGAGGAGFIAANSTGGNGGVGVQNNITGTATWYGGGGAGGLTGASCATTTAALVYGVGGNGGGGNGNGSNGVANTGGGGGGNGGNGGSGVVIVRYYTEWVSSNPAVATVDNQGNVTGVSAGVATISYTNPNGCTVSKDVTVIDIPTMTATPTSATICSGEAVNIVLTPSSATALTAWTINEVGASGAVVDTAFVIDHTLTATGTTPGTVTYSIEIYDGVCIAPALDVVVTVNPLPTASATPNPQTICSGGTTGINLSSTPTGASFDWTVVENGVSGGGPGSGTSIAQTLYPTGSAAGTATYSVTPTLNSCAGSPISVVVNVGAPITGTASPSAQTICSGSATSITLSSPNTGATFDWTVVENGTSGASAGSGNTIAQTLTGISGSTATYTVTPSVGTCAGTPFDVVVTMSQLPSVVATPSSQSVCSGTSTGITLTSTPAGASFAWTVIQTGASGASAGTGSTISQLLNATSTSAGTVTYTVTPTAGTCVGSPSDVIITVNPTPNAVATPTTQTFCSGGTSNISLSSAIAGTSFTWTVNQSGVTGGVAGNGTAITQTLTTTGSMAGGALYTIVPTANGCSGSPIQATVQVNPNPIVDAGPAQTVCQGTVITLAGSGANGYVWDNGVTDNVPFAINSTTTFTVTGATFEGCLGTDVVTITVTPTPIPSLNPSATLACLPADFIFTNTSVDPANTFSWNLGDGTILTGAGPIAHTYTSEGCYNISLTATTPNGCVGVQNYVSLVCAAANPIAEFSSNPSDVTVVYPVVQFNNESTGATNYVWDFGDGSGNSTFVSPNHTFPDVADDYEVMLIAISEFGCRDTAYQYIKVADELIFYVPNTFTPDGDQYNQVFSPVFSSGYDPFDYTMTIYNRWGEVIFESHDVKYGWPGTYGTSSGIVQDGVYTWKLEFKTSFSDARKMFTGSVMLMR